MSKPKSLENLKKRMFDAAGQIMEQHNVPLVITLGVKQPIPEEGKKKRQSRKREIIFGSENLKRFQENLIRDNRETFKEALDKDLLLLCSDETEIQTSASEKLNRRPPPLPRPWKLMNHNNLREFLIECIMVSYHRGGGKRPRIQYSAEFKPVWWISNEWDWSQVTNLREGFILKQTLDSLLKGAIFDQNGRWFCQT